MKQEDLYFIYGVVYLIVGFIFWMIALEFDETFKASLSRGIFWPIWFVVYTIKFILFTGSEIFNTFRNKEH